MKSAVQIREIAFDEMDLIRPLFRQAFATELSGEMLDWKYGGGRGKSFGAFAAENPATLLVHCGLFYRNVLADGQRRRIAHLGDLMALPGRKGGLLRATSPFSVLFHKVLADLPDALNPDGLAFGFPSDRAMRLGEHMGVFAAIDRMYELTCTPLTSSGRSDRCQAFGPSETAFVEIANRLWQQMADSLGGDMIGIRDADYLVQRYFRHPHHRYDCHVVLSRWLGRPLGLLITRMEGGQCELMDVIAHASCLDRLLQVFRQQLQTWGANVARLWLTERHAERYRLHAEEVRPLEFRIMANPFSSGGDYRRFAGRWWLTSGDTDYR